MSAARETLAPDAARLPWEDNFQALNRLRQQEETRTDVLESAIRHVLRYGKVGKQSDARLRAALKAVEVSRG